MYQKRTKRQEQKENTRQKVYTCARRLFDEKGFDNVTMEEIAKEAEVSVGSIYFHFRSKQEIMANYHADLDEVYTKYFYRRQQEQDTDDCLAQLKDFVLYACRASAELGINNVRVVYPYMMCNAEFGSKMLNEERAYYKIMQSLVEECRRNGYLRKDISTPVIIRDLTILVRGCLFDWCIQGGEEDIEISASRLINTFFYGICVKG